MLRKGWLDLWALVALAAALCALAGIAVDVPLHTGGTLTGSGFRSASLLVLALAILAILLTGCALVAYRSKAAAEMAAAERTRLHLQKSLDSLRDGICIWSRERRLVAWNQRYADITGYLSRPIFAGLEFAALIRDAAERLHPELDAAGREAWARSREVGLSRADGTPRHFTTPTGHLIEVIDKATDEGEVVTSLRDVTDDHEAQRRLADSEARFRDGIESMADGFMLWDDRDRLVTWNGRALEMLPYLARMDLTARPFDSFVREAIALARPDWTAAQQEDWVLRRIDHRRRGAPFEFTPDDGTVIETSDRPTSQGGYVTILHDITADRRAQRATEKALEAERETNVQQRRFVSIAGHEFRTPLAIIDSSVQRLEARLDKAPVEEMRRRLERIREAITRMTGIIDMTLTSARVDEGRIAPAPSRFDLVPLAREVILRQRALTPRFEIALAASETGIEITADRALTDQILTNLLSNAAKYSPLANRIEVTISNAGDDAVIAVRDYGVGIPEDEIPKLFTRFFRARTASGFQGTGIGLHLVRELVDLHGGSVEVRSELGRGSVFTVRLPVATTALEALRAVG